MPSLEMINAVCLLVLLMLKESLSLTQMRIHVPAIVKSGDTVTMSCEYDLEEVPLYSIKWYWNDEEFYRFVPKESPPFRAFKVRHVNVDISRSGPTDVTLTNVVRELSGDYKCEVSADAPFFHTDIKVAAMSVIDVPTGLPLINTEIVDEEALGRKIIARCQTPLSVPTANITWYINENKVSRYNPRIKITPLENVFDNGMGSSTSSRSLLHLMIDNSVFINGVVKIKCEASIYSIWNKSTEAVVQEDSFQLYPVVVSTSSQSQMDQVIEIITSSSSASYFVFLEIIKFFQ